MNYHMFKMSTVDWQNYAVLWLIYGTTLVQYTWKA